VQVWTFVESSERAGQKHLVEPYIEDFCKFNSNTGVVFDQHDAWSQAMQALVSGAEVRGQQGHSHMCLFVGLVLRVTCAQAPLLHDASIMQHLTSTYNPNISRPTCL
jgi:hypothetical protein